ncbi:HNH endonuclease [Arthrobacter luteolus]|uniref:HNH endonuclease n=1 Tax=Arthrobacter luteolus TaxID=98672 RepID=UPI00384C85A7
MLEELKSAAAAVQARAAAAFDASQRRAQSRAGVPADQLGRGIGAQVALARRDSPHRGSRLLGLGKALVHEMPYTLAALSAGVLSEWRATLLVRETACLDLEDRARVDELICKDPDKLEGLGDRRLIARIRTVTQALDQASQVKRNAKAVADRYVSCRPAPDTMSYLSALLPVAQGVAVYAALSRAADGLRASGDERGRGQIMADTLVERVTGQASADRVPVEVQLVITDRSLFRQSGPDEPAYFPGYGTVPGHWARELISKALTNPPGHSTVPLNPLRSGNSTQRNSSSPRSPLGRGSPQAPPGSSNSPQSPPRNGNSPQTAPGNSNSSHQTAPGPGNSPQIGEPGGPEPADVVMLRRLYLDPVSGELAAMESRARAFPPGLARLIRTRDQTCRTPWCDAPIRHIDHIQPHAEGGPTTYTNGQGLCEACNHAKQAPGWNSTTLQPRQAEQPQQPPEPVSRLNGTQAVGDHAGGTEFSCTQPYGDPIDATGSSVTQPYGDPIDATGPSGPQTVGDHAGATEPSGNPASGMTYVRPPVSLSAPLPSSPPTMPPGFPPPVLDGPAKSAAQTRHTVSVTTPTGHTYVSVSPPLPGAALCGH